MNDTTIEWADKTWNPTTGCEPVSAGCANCWARRMSVRLKGRFGYPADAPFRPTFHAGRINEPMEWKRPQVVAVSLMGDLFHDRIRDVDIDQVWDTMSWTRHHRYLILTKRPARMRRYLESRPGRRPLPNVALGVSVDDQDTFERRIVDLLGAPATTRFLSYEPAIGPLDIPRGLVAAGIAVQMDRETETVDFGGMGGPIEHRAIASNMTWSVVDGPGLDGVIAGGESGPGARPGHPKWFRDVRDQCAAGGVRFMFKQWGSFGLIDRAGTALAAGDLIAERDGTFTTISDPVRFAKAPKWVEIVRRMPKKAAGRVQDGRTHDDLPWKAYETILGDPL